MSNKRYHVELTDDEWQVLTGILLGLKLRGDDKTFPNFESILKAVRDAESTDGPADKQEP